MSEQSALVSLIEVLKFLTKKKLRNIKGQKIYSLASGRTTISMASSFPAKSSKVNCGDKSPE
jgi:hypothetical protein